MKRVLLIFVYITVSILFALNTHAIPMTVNANDTVVFDLSQATCTGAYTQIPVTILSDDSIYALDFQFKYNQAMLAYDSIFKCRSYFNMFAAYNPVDSIVRFTSYSSALQAYENNKILGSICFNLLSGQLNAAYLNSIVCLLNGDACSYKIIDAFPSSIGISASGPTTINNGDSVALVAAGGTGYSYLWSTGATTQSVEADTAGDYSVTITNIYGCSTAFSINLRMASSLPVELADFYAEKNKEDVILSWTTFSEINNDYFTIEKADPSNSVSADGGELNFNPIGVVKGGGNSTIIRKYSFIDSAPLKGGKETGDRFICYYRLRQTDFNGTSALSKTIAVNFNNQSSMINIYPNPASEKVYINVSWASKNKTGTREADFTLCILDMDGHKVVQDQVLHLSYGMLHPVDVSALSKGIYIVQLYNDSGTQQEKLIID